MPKQRPHIPSDGSIHLSPGYVALGASWRRSLLAANKSQRTVETYLDAHRRFGEYLASQGMPQDVKRIDRAAVELFISDQLARYSPATANNRYRALQQWFGWLVEEDEITKSPMEHMKPPKVPLAPPPVLAVDQIKAILAVCRGGDLRARRDAAIIRLLLDTGLRRQEMATLGVGDIDLDAGEARVLGKNAETRIVSFGHKTAAMLDRYLRARAQHSQADSPALWLGHEGPMTASGIYQVVRDRALEAGLSGVYTHLFRHTWASSWLELGGQEGSAMELAGWKSRSMLDRYGRAERSRRARAEHKRLSPGDKI